MTCLQKRWQAQVLFVPWDPAEPVCVEGENVPMAVHRSIRAAMAHQVVDEVENQPHLLAEMSTLCKEFLRWLLVHGLTPRSLQVKQRLIPALGAILEEQLDKDLYTDYSADSVRSQVDEMVLLAQELGYQKVCLFYQGAETLPPPIMLRLVALVAWRELWQQRNFLFKAALHTAVVEQGQLITKAQDRMEFRRLKWSLADSCQVADVWAGALSGGAVASLEAIVEPALLDVAIAYLQDIRDEHLPADYKELAQLMLGLYSVRSRRLNCNQDESELRRYIYRNLAPLCIVANGTGVRRGTRFIKVREQPLRVLEQLAHIHSGDTRQALLALTGSQNNLHKQISELRKAIEPLPDGSRDWVYVCNTTEGNYVFEGLVEREPVRKQAV